MVSSFASFEVRRWVLAASLTLLVVSLQVAHAARATTGGVAANGADGGPSASGGTAVAVLPVEVRGTVIAVRDDLLGVHEADAPAPVSFPLGGDALLVRDGAAAESDDLRAGDRVRMTIDGRTGQILQLEADPVTAGWSKGLDTVGPLAALALVVTLGFLAARRGASLHSAPRPWLVGGSSGALHSGLTPFGRGRPIVLRHQDRACSA